MPLIDLTEAFTDPMLADTFTVIRRQQVIGNNGRATTSDTTFTGLIGPVYPSTPNELRMLADIQTTEKAITVITEFALQGEAETAGTQFMPDIVQWHGSNFKVAHLEDWTAFGPGFVMAVCTSINLVDAPPAAR